MLHEEAGHRGIGFTQLREADVVPEGVREAVEDDELVRNVVAGLGALHVGGGAEQDIAAGGDEKGRHGVGLQ